MASFVFASNAQTKTTLNMSKTKPNSKKDGNVMQHIVKNSKSLSRFSKTSASSCMSSYRKESNLTR